MTKIYNYPSHLYACCSLRPSGRSAVALLLIWLIMLIIPGEEVHLLDGLFLIRRDSFVDAGIWSEKVVGA